MEGKERHLIKQFSKSHCDIALHCIVAYGVPATNKVGTTRAIQTESRRKIQRHIGAELGRGSTRSEMLEQRRRGALTPRWRK